MIVTKPEKIELTTPFPDVPVLWIDPITGFEIPKNPVQNLAWRTNLLTQAEADVGFQDELYTAASKSLLFFINMFAWTYRVFIVDYDGVMRQCKPHETHVPFVTWAIQDKHILEIEWSIDNGEDLLTDKSRDMGATWDHLVVMYHKWLFQSDRNFLMLSRKEDCVESTGKKGLGKTSDPGTLFGKIDYLSSWLPEWMMPIHTRTTMHLVNLNNGSRIDGESANATAGSSDRRTAILLDEMAKMTEGESIKRSTRDVTACILANSTPDGPGTAFSKWRLSNTVKVFVLPWWEHPEKGAGRYFEKDELTDKEKLRSPWYVKQERIRTPKEMAIEIDMDHIGSGDNFFELATIAKHRKAFATAPPVSAGMHIVFNTNVAVKDMPGAIRKNKIDTVNSRRIPNGPWTFFEALIDERPDQTQDYIFGIDIGKGMGASNSVISVGSVQTRRKIAEFASASFSPHEFAIIVAASGIWFGGSRHGGRPFVIWEANGDPGIYFGKIFVRTLKYPNYYLDRHAANKTKRKKPSQYGWHSSTDKKAELLGDYRRALDHGTFINPSAMALNEAETYVYMTGGAIGPASLQEESASARKTHGDRVIADALLNMAMGESLVRVNKTLEPPQNSLGGRYKEHLDRRKKLKEGKTWDLRANRSQR